MLQKHYFVTYLFYIPVNTTHCCIPESFYMSIPIPKRVAGSMTGVKHYRGITLSSIFL